MSLDLKKKFFYDLCLRCSFWDSAYKVKQDPISVDTRSVCLSVCQSSVARKINKIQN